MIETTAAIKIVYNFFVVIISSILAYLNLEQEPIFLLSLLLLIDYITGLFKAKTLGHSITSNKMKYGLISKLLLLLIPIVLAIGGKAVGADFHYVLMTGMTILIISEIYSIIGNIYATRTKEEFPEYDAVAMIGKRIRCFLIKQSGDRDA
ncbi:phage holin family protein [Aliarcobacter butzleri]|uniref:phage holin family protein n=1 Tax=Aliarcobacter butzleri TaxID=28197 RepID=UPI003AFADB8D